MDRVRKLADEATVRRSKSPIPDPLLLGGPTGSRRGAVAAELPALSPLRVVSLDGQRIKDLAGPERWRPFIEH